MRSLLTIILAPGVSLAAGQCDGEADWTACGAEDFFNKPDPAAYECDAGCVRHRICEEDFKYDDRHEFCTNPRDVACGDRPCDDPVHCPGPCTSTTEEHDFSQTSMVQDTILMNTTVGSSGTASRESTMENISCAHKTVMTHKPPCVTLFSWGATFQSRPNVS